MWGFVVKNLKAVGKIAVVDAAVRKATDLGKKAYFAVHENVTDIPTEGGGHFFSSMDGKFIKAMYYHPTKSHIAIACNGNGERKSIRAGPGDMAVAIVPRTTSDNETHYWTDDESKLDPKWKPVEDGENA